MRRTVLAVALTAFVVAVLATVAYAQPTQTARGTISAITADAVTIASADRPMTFTVDAKTVVTAVGAGTATRAAEAAGKAGPKLTEVLKVGEPVEVSYHDVGGKLHAASIRRTRSAGGASDAMKAEIANGTVEAVSQSSMTITGAGSAGSSFRQSFTIDGDTKVIGQGVGTAAREKDGKVTAPDLVAVGDRVSVSYHKAGSTLHAAEIRVTAKK